MKRYQMSIYKIFCDYEIFMILYIFILQLVRIKSFQNFKAIYISNNNYWIIKQNSINYYSNNQLNVIKIFDDNQRITTIEELDIASFGTFKEESDSGIANLVIIKNYVYAIFNGQFLCDYLLNEITNVLSTDIIPYKCSYNSCFYIVGIIQNNKNLCLYLYKNPSDSCSSRVVGTVTINNVNYNLKCEFMLLSSNEKVLTCFYQNGDIKQIIAKSFRINVSNPYSNPNFQDISLTATKYNNGAKVIKSILSKDGKKSFVCFINDDNNGDCLIY